MLKPRKQPDSKLKPKLQQRKLQPKRKPKKKQQLRQKLTPKQQPRQKLTPKQQPLKPKQMPRPKLRPMQQPKQQPTPKQQPRLKPMLQPSLKQKQTKKNRKLVMQGLKLSKRLLVLLPLSLVQPLSPLLLQINALSSPKMAPSTISQSSNQALLTTKTSSVTRAGSIGTTVKSLAMEYTPHIPIITAVKMLSPQEAHILLLLKIFVTLLWMIFQGISKAFASPTNLTLNVMRELERCMSS